MNTVSVIIPAYNYAQYLSEAVDSALGQTVPPLEVVIVDDGSTDTTPHVVAGYGKRVRAIRQTNQGVAAARNTGLAAARGSHVAFLDSDDIWYPRKLELQLARFAAQPALGLVHCGAEEFDDTGRTLRTRIDGMEGWVAGDLLRLDREVIALPSSTMIVPKRVADEIGGFDTRLPPSEDWDFCYRVASRYEVGYVPQVLLRYRQHGRGGHLNIPAMERAMLLALEKHFATDDPAVQAVKKHCYGRLHCILAGCYFETGQPRAVMLHTFRSLQYDIGNLAYFAAYPLRVLRRALDAPRSSH